MNLFKRTLAAALLGSGLTGAFQAAGVSAADFTGTAASAGVSEAAGVSETAFVPEAAFASETAGVSEASGTARAPQSEAPRAFRLPDIPDGLTTPEERADYLTRHYWDHFDFADTTLIARPEITEQAFVDFLSVLPYTRQAQAAVDTLVERTLVSKTMFYHFVELADKYLYEPNSPMHNEELHILVLRALVNNPRVEELDKLRPRRLLDLALRNRPGDTAADFVFTGRDGRQRRLSEIEAEFLLLYFNDPECDECRSMKERLAASPTVCGLLESGRLKVLSVCVEGRTAAWERATLPAGWIDGCDAGQRLTRDGVYDLKAMPTLYLLDARKRVLLKDAPLDRIEALLDGKR